MAEPKNDEQLLAGVNSGPGEDAGLDTREKPLGHGVSLRGKRAGMMGRQSVNLAERMRGLQERVARARAEAADLAAELDEEAREALTLSGRVALAGPRGLSRAVQKARSQAIQSAEGAKSARKVESGTQTKPSALHPVPPAEPAAAPAPVSAPASPPSPSAVSPAASAPAAPAVFRPALQGIEARVGVKLVHPEARMPRYAHLGPYGDLAADVYGVETITLSPLGTPGATQTVATGLILHLPPTHGALIEDRSGMAVRGVTTLAGVIDPGYRGELKIVLTNLTDDALQVKSGHRVAQLRIVRRIEAVFEEISEAAAETPRGEDGFGSTGL